jgi:hypothetical protein
MKEKVILELEKVTFTNKKIIVKTRKKEVVIEYDNVKEGSYNKKNFFNYLLMQASNYPPGWLFIKFKNKIGKRSSIVFKIEHEELLKLPNEIVNALTLYDYFRLGN